MPWALSEAVTIDALCKRWSVTPSALLSESAYTIHQTLGIAGLVEGDADGVSASSLTPDQSEEQRLFG
jgi:hypothetical protein